MKQNKRKLAVNERKHGNTPTITRIAVFFFDFLFCLYSLQIKQFAFKIEG